MKKPFGLRRLLFLVFFLCTEPTKSQELIPLKVYIRDSLYHDVKKVLPTILPLKEENSRDSLARKRSIEWIPLSGAELYKRLQGEKEHPVADVVIGLEAEWTSDLKGSPFLPETREHLYFPFQWKNKIFLPLYYGYVAVFYNKEKISVPSQSLWELVSVKTGEALVFPDPHTDNVGFKFIEWLIASLPHAKPENWTIFKSKIKNIPSSWETAYHLLLKGEASMIVSYTTVMASKENNHMKAVFYPEGNPVHIFVGFKTLKAVKDPDGDEILTLFTSEAIQKLIAHEFGMYPVLEDARIDDLLHIPKPDKIFMPSSRSRQEVLDRWKKIMNE